MARKLEEIAAKKSKKQGPEARVKQLMLFSNMWQDAKEAYFVAAHGEAQSEAYLLTARLAVSEAEKDMYVARWEHACLSEAAQ